MLLRVQNDMGVSDKRPNFHFGVEYSFNFLIKKQYMLTQEHI